MKTFAAFMLLLCTLFSCNKDTKDSIDPTEEPDTTPLQLVKKILRYEVGGQFYTDSNAYAYDATGHLAAILDPKTNLPISRFLYDSDNLIARIDYSNGKADTLHNPFKLLDSGNTILLDHTRPNPNGGTDTIQLTYKWLGNQLLESWTYLHFSNSNAYLHKSYFSYSDGNQNESTTLFSDGNLQWQSRGLEYDQKKNYFHSIPRLNYILGGWGFPYATRSVNNPVKAAMPSGQQVEYIWTYNDKGFPLTMQIKGTNYIALELQYNK